MLPYLAGQMPNSAARANAPVVAQARAHTRTHACAELCARRNAALVAAIARHRCIHIIVFNKSDLVPRSSFGKLSTIAASEGAHSHVFLDSLRASSRRQVRARTPQLALRAL